MYKNCHIEFNIIANYSIWMPVFKLYILLHEIKLHFIFIFQEKQFVLSCKPDDIQFRQILFSNFPDNTYVL